MVAYSYAGEVATAAAAPPLSLAAGQDRPASAFSAYVRPHHATGADGNERHAGGSSGGGPSPSTGGGHHQQPNGSSSSDSLHHGSSPEELAAAEGMINIKEEIMAASTHHQHHHHHHHHRSHHGHTHSHHRGAERDHHSSDDEAQGRAKGDPHNAAADRNSEEPSVSAVISAAAQQQQHGAMLPHIQQQLLQLLQQQQLLADGAKAATGCGRADVAPGLPLATQLQLQQALQGALAEQVQQAVQQMVAQQAAQQQLQQLATQAHALQQQHQHQQVAQQHLLQLQSAQQQQQAAAARADLTSNPYADITNVAMAEDMDEDEVADEDEAADSEMDVDGEGGDQDTTVSNESGIPVDLDERMAITVDSDNDKGCQVMLLTDGTLPGFSSRRAHQRDSDQPAAAPSSHALARTDSETGRPSRHGVGTKRKAAQQQQGVSGPSASNPGAASSAQLHERALLMDTGDMGATTGMAADGQGSSEGACKAPKKPRINWSQELHARFLNAMFQLGVKSAVPKTILQLMNVEGLTRENVASHLQKYRILLKRHAQLPANAPLIPDNLRKLEIVQQAVQQSMQQSMAASAALAAGHAPPAQPALLNVSIGGGATINYQDLINQLNSMTSHSSSSGSVGVSLVVPSSSAHHHAHAHHHTHHHVPAAAPQVHAITAAPATTLAAVNAAAAAAPSAAAIQQAAALQGLQRHAVAGGSNGNVISVITSPSGMMPISICPVPVNGLNGVSVSGLGGLNGAVSVNGLSALNSLQNLPAGAVGSGLGGMSVGGLGAALNGVSFNGLSGLNASVLGQAISVLGPQVLAGGATTASNLAALVSAGAQGQAALVSAAQQHEHQVSSNNSTGTNLQLH